MSTAALDTYGDWTFGRGKYGYLAGVEEVKQNVTTRLKEFVDDWFLDVEKGINWIGYLGSKNTELALLADIKRVILETEGVAAITFIDVVNLGDRSLQIDYTITTIYNIDLNDRVGVSA